MLYAGCYLQPLSKQWQQADLQSFKQGGPLAVDVLVRHEQDPYLYFIDISEGRLDFGLSRGEKVLTSCCQWHRHLDVIDAPQRTVATEPCVLVVSIQGTVLAWLPPTQPGPHQLEAHVQLRIGFTCLGLGIILTAIICGCCFMIVKFARGFGSGKKQARPANPVGGALYDVSAKYGNFIPGGGTAVGQPVHQGTPVQGQAQGGKPGMYDTGNAGGGGYDGGGGYNGGTSYDSGAPVGYPNAAGGAQGYGNSSNVPYGNAGPQYGSNAPTYNQQGAYGVGNGGGNNAPPPGYPGAAV